MLLNCFGACWNRKSMVWLSFSFQKTGDLTDRARQNKEGMKRVKKREPLSQYIHFCRDINYIVTAVLYSVNSPRHWWVLCFDATNALVCSRKKGIIYIYIYIYIYISVRVCACLKEYSTIQKFEISIIFFINIYFYSESICIKLIKCDSLDLYNVKDFHFKEIRFLWTFSKSKNPEEKSSYPQQYQAAQLI